MNRRHFAAAVIAAVTLLAPATGHAITHTPVAVQCRVIGSGDSLFSAPSLFFPDDWCIDVESGRDPFHHLQDGGHDSYDMLMSQVDDVPRGGWLVIQDYNHILSTTAAQWRQLLHDVVAALPNGRCVLGIAPYRAPLGYVHADYAMWLDSKARTVVMSEELAKQGCFEIISLHTVVHTHTWYMDDGVHLSTAGVDWMIYKMIQVMGA